METQKDVEKVVDRITKELMTNAFGQRALRLQLRGDNEVDLGGNCEMSVRRIIRDELMKEIKKG